MSPNNSHGFPDQPLGAPDPGAYLENLGIHGILDTGGKILETGGIFGELKKILKI